MALAFVLLEEIEDVYMHLIDEANELFDKSIFDKLEKWIDYFLNTWFSDGTDGHKAMYFLEKCGINLKKMDRGLIIMVRLIMGN